MNMNLFKNLEEGYSIDFVEHLCNFSSGVTPKGSHGG
jgi:hypothetical protein